MAQYIDVIGVGTVEFPDGMTKEEMAEALKKLPSAKQQPVEEAAPAAKPTMPSLPAKQTAQWSVTNESQELPYTSTGTKFGKMIPTGVTSAKDIDRNKPQFNVNQIAKDPELFKRVESYMVSTGKEPYKAGQSKEEYVDQFMSTRTFREMSTLFGQIPELNRMVGGNEQTRKSVAEGIQLYEQTATREGLQPYIDVAKGLATELPVAAVSGAAGKVGTQAAYKSVVKGATQKGISRAGIAGVAGIESLTAGASDITSQRLRQEVEKTFGQEPKPLDAGSIAVAMIFGGALGAVGGKAANPTKVVKQGEAINKALEKKNIVPKTPTSPTTPAEKAVLDPVVEQMDRVYNEYVQQTGKELIDAIDPANSLTDAKVKTEMSKAAVRIAMKAIEVDPQFAMKPNEQISTAINNVFSNLDKIDDVSLERVLVDSGVDPKEFAMMNKVTVSEAARVMQQYSAAARVLKQAMSRDTAFDKKIKDLYDMNDVATDGFSNFMQAQEALAREWKAWITSGVDTTARNTLSTALVLPMKSGVQFMEGMMFSIGNAASDSARGNRAQTFYKSMGDTIKDSFDVYFYLKENGLATDITDTLLKDSPSLRNQIIQSLQETGNKDISEVGKWANSLNVAVDAFSRRAIFTASVEQQLRRQGKDLYKDFLATDTGVPTDILKRATKDALQATFAYLPKRGGDPLVASSLERAAGEAASAVISAVDKTPFINFAIPFPRYMANAMGYLYRYSPVGSVGAGQELLQVRKLAAAGETEKAMLLHRQASEHLIQSAIGTAALVSAYEYRKENADKPWYEVETKEGNTVDIRPLGIPAPYFAIADVIVRQEQGTLKLGDTKAAIEAITGLKTKAGSQDTFADRLFNAMSDETEFKGLMVEMGKSVGDIAGGFTQPFVLKQFADFINLVREEGRVARDPNIIGDNKEVERAVEGALPEATPDWLRQKAGATAQGAAIIGETAAKRVAGKLPVLKEELPEAVVRLSNEDIAREGEYFNRLMGFRQITERSPEEKEVIRLNLNPYRLYGSSTGDKEYDKDVITAANERVLPAIKAVMNTEEYNALTDKKKVVKLTKVITKEVSNAKTMVNEKYKGKDLKRIYKMKYNKLPTPMRRAIDEAYAKANDGKSIDDNEDYFAVDEYEAVIDAETNYAKGGLVSNDVHRQTQRMLSTAR